VKIAISFAVVCVAFGLSMEEAQAGLCTKEVNQFERAIRHSSMSPTPGQPHRRQLERSSITSRRLPRSGPQKRVRNHDLPISWRMPKHSMREASIMPACVS
jgi:hypothetical protein